MNQFENALNAAQAHLDACYKCKCDLESKQADAQTKLRDADFAIKTNSLTALMGDKTARAAVDAARTTLNEATATLAEIGVAQKGAIDAIADAQRSVAVVTSELHRSRLPALIERRIEAAREFDDAMIAAIAAIAKFKRLGEEMAVPASYYLSSGHVTTEGCDSQIYNAFPNVITDKYFSMSPTKKWESLAASERNLWAGRGIDMREPA